MSLRMYKGGSMSFAQILDEELVSPGTVSRQKSMCSRMLIQIYIVQPAPPPSFAEIMKSFSKDGNGDAKTLLAILSAKQAEEDVSLASLLNRFCILV
jgi:hypothetical protein